MGLADFSIKSIQNTFVKNDFSKQHYLKLLDFVNVPDYVSNQFIDENARAYITASSWPARTNNIMEIPHSGFTFRAPNNVSYPGTYPVTMSAPANFLGIDAIHRWSFATGNEATSCGIVPSFPCQDSQAIWALMGPNCQIIRGFRLIGIFPTEVGEIAYDQTSTERVTFTFNLAYQRWEPLDINDVIDVSASNEIDSIFEGFESKIAAGVGSNCANKTNIPRV